MKSTAIAPTNIAFIKYWGKKDEVLRLPCNGSISMNLSEMTTKTTVEFNPSLHEDHIEINGEVEPIANNRASQHLDRIRALAKISTRAHVITHTNFPRSTGLSSSASGFAALTLAGCQAAGLSLSKRDLSILARQGSGSACRSIPDGFVEWLDGDTSETSYAISIFPPDYWDIVDVAVIVSTGKKNIGSTEGMKLKNSSPFFDTRLHSMKEKLTLCTMYIKEKNFFAFGELIEEEALNMHAVMITSRPSLLYWTPESLTVMKMVQKWRQEGLPAYFTVNTGQDVHVIVEKKNAIELINNLKKLDTVKKLIENHASVGAHTV